MVDKKKDKVMDKIATHDALQHLEEDVKVSGDGFRDAYVPKEPTTDSFYDNVSNWSR